MKIEADNDIILRKVRMKSAQEIYASIDRSREFLGEWLPFVDRTLSVEDTEKFIKALKKHKDAKHELVLEIRLGEVFAGLIGLKDIDEVNKKAEIGYWLDREYAGKGIMLRSCRALIGYSFHKLELNRLTIRCAVENMRSCNIPKQLGFTFEGIERHGEILRGRHLDLKVYSLLKKEWNNNP